MPTKQKQIVTIVVLALALLVCVTVWKFLFFVFSMGSFVWGIALAYGGCVMIKEQFFGIQRHDNDLGGWTERAAPHSGRNGALCVLVGITMTVIGFKLMPIAEKLI